MHQALKYCRVHACIRTVSIKVRTRPQLDDRSYVGNLTISVPLLQLYRSTRSTVRGLQPDTLCALVGLGTSDNNVYYPKAQYTHRPEPVYALTLMSANFSQIRADALPNQSESLRRRVLQRPSLYATERERDVVR
jgi:hypothetical protein